MLVALLLVAVGSSQGCWRDSDSGSAGSSGGAVFRNLGKR
jgi:hypothetical protein